MPEIRPIRDDESHAAALAEIDRLWGAADGSPDGDRLEVLAILIDDFERKRWPTARVDPVEAIKAHLQMNGLAQADLAKLLGSEPRASEILNRRRRLTVDMIAKLTSARGLPADWLVQPYDLACCVTKNDAARATKTGTHPGLSGNRFAIRTAAKALG